MSTKHLILASAALLSVMAAPAHATQPAPAQPAHQMAVPAPTGNADVDFVQAMIPHHEAAVKMSEEYIKKSKDPMIKRLATQILNSQNNEIKTMEMWLKKNGPKKPAE